MCHNIIELHTEKSDQAKKIIKEIGGRISLAIKKKKEERTGQSIRKTRPESESSKREKTEKTRELEKEGEKNSMV